MANANMTDWKNSVYPICAVPEPSLIEAIRSAAREFCSKTHLWAITLDRIDVAEDTQDYALTMPSAWLNKAEVVIVDDAKYKQDGEDDDQFITLDPISENQYDLNESGSWIFQTAPTPSKYFVPIDDKKIYLWKIPTEDSTEGLLVKVVVRPTLSATELPEFLYLDHRDTIKIGALAYLFGQKESSWYDELKAAGFRTDFKNAYNSAKFQKISGATKRPMTVRYNKSFCP